MEVPRSCRTPPWLGFLRSVTFLGRLVSERLTGLPVVVVGKPFDICVDVLLIAAEKIDPYWPGGMDYRKINVLIFCVAGPIILGVIACGRSIKMPALL